MLILDDFQALQRKVERLKAERDATRGATAQLKERLAKEFDCPTVAAARTLLTKLETKERRLAAEYTAAKAEFERTFAKELTALED